ncbi:hypothetical protein RDI58_027207 [Solanum bulbocastanum]|uniref:Uncharacterized protein n=1 Tax=Solanum bulbocastanum TaxID=147425 RepID=A0AAN8T0D3_SOLBU
MGKPLCVDDSTIKAERISYARMLVEKDVTRTLPSSVNVGDPTGKEVDQTVLYDWRPLHCPICCQIGYSCPAMRMKQDAAQAAEQ